MGSSCPKNPFRVFLSRPLVLSLVEDLVDPDPGQPVEGINRGAGLVHDPVHERPDRGPRDAHVLPQLRRNRCHTLTSGTPFSPSWIEAFTQLET
jgi:hypothetical protein